MTNSRGLSVSEKFRNLEEAHEKLRDDFRFSRLEWEKDKSLLSQEIQSLQTRLDFQTRTSENFQTQLWICNRALAHEESSVLEYKSRFDDVSSECGEARMIIEKRDEEVAKLRDELRAKELLLKEMGYKMQPFETENKDLMANGKEHQESVISNCGSTSPVKKRQKKCNQLEHELKNCGEKLKVDLDLQQRLALQETLMAEKQVEIDDMHRDLLKLEDEASGLRVKVKVKDEAFLKSTQRVKELEDLLRVNKLETDNLIKRFGDERTQLEDEVYGLCEKVKVKDESLSKSTQRSEELEDLLRINRLETENLMKQFGEEKACLENEVSSLCEKVKVNDESMLKSAQRVKELEGLLRVNQLEIEKLTLRFGDEKTHLENEVSDLCEKVKIKDELLLTSTQRAEELENLVRISRLETENLIKQSGDEKTRLEIEVSGLCAKVKVRDEFLLNSTRRVEELEDLVRANKLEIENLVTRFAAERTHLENEVFGLREKVKVKDESLLKSTQQAEELEDLLRIIRQETENLMTRSGDEKVRLEDEVSDLCEKVKVIDEPMLKSTQRVKELEDLLRVNKLEIENLVTRFGAERTHLESEASGLCWKLKARDKLEDLLFSHIKVRDEALEELKRINKLETADLIKRFRDEITCLENEVSGLREKVKVNDESMLKSTQRVKELEDLENEVFDLCEKVNIKDELLLASSQRVEELENLVRISRLETENLMNLENEVSRLYEKVKVNDESLSKSTQRVEELEDLLRVNKVEIGNLMKRFGDERTHLENEVTALCEQVKDKDALLFKSIQRAEQLENSVRISRLETENLTKQFGEEKIRLENEVSGLREKVKDESLLKSTQRVKELEDLLHVSKLGIKNLMKQFGDEVSGLRWKLKAKDKIDDLLFLHVKLRDEAIEELKDINKLETVDLVKRFGDEIMQLEDEVSGLSEKVKVKNELLLKATQRVEELKELENLLRISRSETENLTKQYRDEKTCLESRVNDLEAQNQALYQVIGKISSYKDDLVVASKQMEQCFKDDELTRMLVNKC